VFAEDGELSSAVLVMAGPCGGPRPGGVAGGTGNGAPRARRRGGKGAEL
jgi:hypothetical protein